MEVIPAVDIRGGRCVRLVQGDYERETVFADDPAEVARRWQDAGAPRIHVVDLDGAREGRAVNRGAVERVLRAVDVPLQIGGGIRDLPTVNSYLSAGFDRVVLGTAAVKDESLLRKALERFGERIVVGVDAREGVVVTEGWLEASGVTAVGLVRRLSSMGVARIVYTDVLRDGTLTEPNFAALAQLSHAAPGVRLIASGGVSSIEHLRRLSEMGVEGAIVGRALYTGALDLRAAMAELSHR